MAHYSLLWPLGLDFESQLASVDMETLDARVTACLHEGGGTWEPLATCIVQGAFGFKMTHLEIPSGGDLTLTGSANWPVLGARNFDVWEPPRLLGTYGGTWNTDLYDSTNFQSIEVGDALAVTERTTAGDFSLAVPRGPQGSVLSNVGIVTKGLNGVASGTLNLPTYELFVRTIGTFAGISVGSTNSISAEVTDIHSTGNFTTTWFQTTISPTVSHAYSPSTKVYRLKVQRPYNTTTAAGLAILAVGARYALSSLRP